MPRHEGFWSSAAALPDRIHEDPWQAWLPFPKGHAESWPGEAAFLIALAEVEAAMIAQERVVSYRGYSCCRLCADLYLNGRREFRHPNWVWPEGFRHYVAVHHVRPRPAFETWVLSRAALKPDARRLPADHTFPPTTPRVPGATHKRLADLLRARIER
jgi:hypothetical protein